MFARVVFTSFLLGSTVFSQYHYEDTTLAPLFTIFYLIVAVIFFLSLLYAMLFQRIKSQLLFAYLQMVIDSFIISLIVYITGGFFSLFTFLYLLVTIYASMLLYLRGGLVMAALCSMQYAILLLLESGNVIPPMAFAYSGGTALSGVNGLSMLYKILTTSGACFGIAVLSGFLTEQNRRVRQDLQAMETHVKRVEKMAYMGEMAAGLAHEIKNPLASLVGSIQLLKDELHYDPDHERLMEIVLRETDRLSTLVNEFLIFARPPAGKPEMLHLKESIAEIIDLFKKDAHHARRFLLKEDLAGSVRVVMDPTHLRQVLWNLLLNAAEAVPDGGQIDIYTAVTKNNQVRICVKDNGCGMSPEVFQCIFDPFFTTKSEGTGLGLSIVHRILESYGSRLDVRTGVGSGSTFSFNLDRAGKTGSE